MRITSIIFFLLLSACAGKVPKRTLENYYSPAGVDKYFLNDIPSWANFDQKAGCFRNSDIRYFNIDALMKSFRYSYNEALQVQASFNEEYARLRQASSSGLPILKEEELLFFKVSEKINNKILFFDSPVFQRINLIWLDEIFDDPSKESKLKDFLRAPANDQGVPVLVSFCLTREAVEKRYPDVNAKMITAELFSVYDKNGKATPGFKFDLEQFFKPNQKIYFYSQKKDMVPNDVLVGAIKILNY